MLKKIFTKEMLGNAAVTLGVVMVGLYVHDRFVRPHVAKSNAKSAPTAPTAPASNGNGSSEDED